MRMKIFLATVASLVAVGNSSKVIEYSSTTDDTVVNVINTATSGGRIGIMATVTGSNANAVKARATGTNSTGVWGITSNAAGYGLYGSGGPGYGIYGHVTGTNPAVTGEATGSGGVGILGIANHASANYAVRGVAGSSIGVYGSSTTGEGVRGASTDSSGVYATSTNGSGLRAVSTNAVGISTTGGTYGAEASSAGFNGIGVVGHGTGTNGIGIKGNSTSYIGIFGNGGQSGVEGTGANAGVVGQGGSTGVVGLGDFVGVSATATGGEWTKGVESQGVGGDYAYGIWARALSGSVENWAGYFDGDVTITGVCSPCTISDATLKKNARPMRGSLAKILALKPTSYEMKTEEYANRITLSKGIQHGLIAQELEKVYPELVHAVTAPPRLTADERKRGVKKQGTTVKGVNYTALIPILIQAIQEQQAEIEALKAGR